MSKLNLEQYFNMSDFLNNKSEEDFKKYKKEFQTEYNNEMKLDYLTRCLNSEKDKAYEVNNIFERVSTIEKSIVIFAFILGLVLTFLFYDKEINIKLYIITSVIIPLVYFGYLVYRYFTYKFPYKEESSILSSLLKKLFNKPVEKHSHVLKTYSLMIWTKFAISYAVGVLLSTFIIFNTQSVTFYSGTTYGANDYKQTKDINNSDVNLTKHDGISGNNKNQQHSSAYWSRVISIILIIMIFLKIGLYLLAKKNNTKTIKQALVNQGEKFFEILNKNVEIGLSEENNIDTDISKHEQNENKLQQQEGTDLKDYYILYYQINPDDQNKIEYDISNKNNLKDKTFNSYSYGLFNKEEDDNKTLQKLNSLVVVYTSPETIPDETFKENMLNILKTNVTDIWIVPLKDDNNQLNLLRKNDKDYAKWEKVISSINNNHIRIHFEV